MTDTLIRTYGACPTKKARRSKADMEGIKAAIYNILADDRPMTVRQVFYQLVTRGVIDKTEGEYQRTVVRLLTDMRLAGELPFSWIVDHSRQRRENQTYDNIADALEDTATFYRKSALKDAPAYIEVWVEKEALSGVLWEAVSDYDVPLLASKGMPSLTFLHSTAQKIREEMRYRGRPSFIYQFGDHDPTGALIPRTIESRLREFCPDIEFTVERVAITEEQISTFDLPTRPTKRDGNRHAADFEGDSVELDALPSRTLRQMAREVIEQHITPHALSILRTAEESERELLTSWAEQFDGGAS